MGCGVWLLTRSIVILNPLRTPEHLRVFLNCHFHNTFPRGSSDSKQLLLEAPNEKHYYDAWSISRTAKRNKIMELHCNDFKTINFVNESLKIYSLH